MKESDTAKKHRVGSPVDARIVSLFAGAIALLAPIIITLTLTSSHLSIRAMSWWIEFESNRVVIDYSPALWGSTFLLTAPRLIFAYQVFRYYENRSTRALTVLVGFVTELPMWIAATMLTAIGAWSPSITVPTPFMVIFSIVMLWKWPYSEPEMPW
ncbi:MAG: hypothetical protein ACXADD_19870 [Candidatus Thorarchaeota archaeon]|jgi:hypothetical protein